MVYIKTGDVMHNYKKQLMGIRIAHAKYAFNTFFLIVHATLRVLMTEFEIIASIIIIQSMGTHAKSTFTLRSSQEVY